MVPAIIKLELFHLLILGLALAFIQPLHSISTQSFLFWPLAFLSLLSSLLVGCSSPGFVQIQPTKLDGTHHKQSSSLASNTTALSARNPQTAPPQQLSPRAIPILKTSPNFEFLPSLDDSSRLQASMSDNSSVAIDMSGLQSSQRSRTSIQIDVNQEASQQFQADQSEEKEQNSLENQKEIISEVKEEIQTRYCLVCHVDQPVRAKHCLKCNRCILTYDHHCPYLGVCVGEKNRNKFFLFVVLQFVECCVGVWVCGSDLEGGEGEEWVQKNIANVLLGTLGLAFGVFVWSLVVCHGWLACLNMTTWEALRWKKISYLANMKRFRSPFSGTVEKNLKMFCWPGREPIVWRYVQ